MESKVSMKNFIHKFYQNGQYILLDINSGAVHLIDETVFDLLDTFNGENDEETLAAWEHKYGAAEIEEVLGELKQLIKEGSLFAPEIEEPPSFRQTGQVKSLCLMVAQDCNLRCRYCFGDGGSYGENRAMMTKDTGRRAVDFLLQASGNRRHLEIDFFGGEPLMNLDMIKDVAEYVRAKERETGKKIKLTLTTNGILLNDETVAWLNENNISVVLSLDGRKSTHDRMRPDAAGNGSYDRSVKNFRRLVESRHGKDYFLRGTYTKENLDFTNDVLAMREAGFDVLSMESVVLKDSPLAITEADLPLVYAEYDRLTEVYKAAAASDRGFFFFHFNIDLNGGPCVAKRLAGCGAGHEYLAVAADGSLYPCHQFVGRGKYRLGHVNIGVTDDHWPNYFRHSHVLNKSKCRECWARFFCSGGCHANADLFNGDIREPYEVGCRLQRKRLECALYIQATATN